MLRRLALVSAAILVAAAVFAGLSAPERVSAQARITATAKLEPTRTRKVPARRNVLKRTKLLKRTHLLKHSKTLKHAKSLKRAAAPKPAAAAPGDPLLGAAWGLRAAGAPDIWGLGEGSPSVVVAVLDTGVDATQPDLQGALVPGWNVLTGTADTADDFGHGTAVAGVIAARAHNGIGASGFCPKCSIMPVKVLDANGSGSGAGIAQGIDWAVAHGATVVNLSLALTGKDDAVAASIASAVAHNVLVVASAGNAGSTTPTYPAVEPGVVSVAGVDPSNQLYSWSSRGGWVDVTAAGCNQASARGGGFGEFCGTSSSAAAVSGLLGLALSDGVSAAAIHAALPARTGDESMHAVDARTLVGGLLPVLTRRSE
jgi:subtilisin family serine protease